jgi:hypothetical protein
VSSVSSVFSVAIIFALRFEVDTDFSVITSGI